MNVQRIREVMAGRGEPFIIRTSDGQSYNVPHPDFVAVGQGIVIIIGTNDRVSKLDPRHITAIEERAGA